MTYTLYVGAIALALYFLEPLLADWIYLQSQRLLLFCRTFLFKIKMEWELFKIRYQRNKYEQMAKEILRDLRNDETER